MTGRILRIELRRSAAWWIGPVVVVVGAVMLYALVDRTWGGRWAQLAIWQREYLLLLIPLVIGAGAWQGRRERKARVGELLATTPRPPWQPATATAAALAIAAAAGYLGAFAAGVPQVARTATYFSTVWVPVVAVGALALVAAAVVGLAVGRLLPTRLTPPVAAVAGLAAMLLPGVFGGEGVPRLYLLEPLGITSFQNDFVTFTPKVHLLQTLEFGGLAVTGLLVIAATRPAGRLLALLPVVGAVAAVVALLPLDFGAAMAPDRGAYALVCTRNAPSVCVTKVHARALDDLRGPARQALATMAAKLPGAPIRVVEAHTEWIDADRQPQPPDTVLVDLSVKANGHMDAYTAQNLQWDLVDGAGTRPCNNIFKSGFNSGRHHDARAAVAAWLLGKPPGPDRGDDADKAYDALVRLPLAEQQARVVAFRQAALACDGRDLIDVLIGKGGPA